MQKATPTTVSESVINRVLLVLICAQFIITIDTTFMNVSLSTLVIDLGTTVTGVQNAITLYALVMAALMIPGAKFGDIIGRKRAFILGLLVYALGTTVTSLAGNLSVFMVGWSFLEGVGAALMLPAMMSLIVDNFPPGKHRARAYAAFAASAGVAAGLGPVVGGLFTTYLSWRLAFASELLVALFILSQRRLLREQVLSGAKTHFDWLGFCFSATGLVTLVEGIIMASNYGLLRARKDFQFLGVHLTAGGISPTVVFVLLGLVILVVFWLIEARRLAQRKDTLLDVGLLKKRIISAGCTVQLIQALVLTATIFALSLYVQMELGYQAIGSGITLLTLSVGVLALSAGAARILSKRYAPKHIMLVGFALIVLGDLVMGLVAHDATSGMDFFWGLLLIGSGVGSVVSQNQNMLISSVSAAQTNETSGLINTFQNVGSSLGTSIAGALIIAVFISVATSAVSASTMFDATQKTALNQAIITKGQIVSNEQLAQATTHVPHSKQSEVMRINAQARHEALMTIYYVIGFVGLVGVIAAWRMPTTKPLAGSQPTL